MTRARIFGNREMQYTVLWIKVGDTEFPKDMGLTNYVTDSVS